MSARPKTSEVAAGLNIAANALIEALEGLDAAGAMPRLRQRLQHAVPMTRAGVKLSQVQAEEGQQLEQVWIAFDVLAEVVETRMSQED